MVKRKRVSRRTTRRSRVRRKKTRRVRRVSRKRRKRTKGLSYQTGTSIKSYDVRHKAKKPGKRKSATGKIYYERRANRSDKGKYL